MKQRIAKLFIKAYEISKGDDPALIRMKQQFSIERADAMIDLMTLVLEDLKEGAQKAKTSEELVKFLTDSYKGLYKDCQKEKAKAKSNFQKADEIAQKHRDEEPQKKEEPKAASLRLLKAAEALQAERPELAARCLALASQVLHT